MEKELFKSCELTRPEAIQHLQQIDFLVVRAMERARRGRLPKHMKTTAVEGYMQDREALKMAIDALKPIETDPDVIEVVADR